MTSWLCMKMNNGPWMNTKLIEWGHLRCKLSLETTVRYLEQGINGIRK